MEPGSRLLYSQEPENGAYLDSGTFRPLSHTQHTKCVDATLSSSSIAPIPQRTTACQGDILGGSRLSCKTIE
jgi:hypothetical protein